MEGGWKQVSPDIILNLIPIYNNALSPDFLSDNFADICNTIALATNTAPVDTIASLTASWETQIAFKKATWADQEHADFLACEEAVN